MRYLSLAEVLLLHHLVMEQSGQQSLLRDLGALESAIAQPPQTFGDEDLYPGLAGKAQEKAHVWRTESRPNPA